MSSPTSLLSEEIAEFPPIFDTLMDLVLPCIPETSTSILILLLNLNSFASEEKFLELYTWKIEDVIIFKI